MNALFILIGIGLLYLGGELLVKSASRLARAWGISPLVIGLTVVAFGTSAPELATSLLAALQGSPEIAIGNVVGSNIANIALILALSALVYPLRTRAAFLKREMPFMIAVAALLIVFLLDGHLSRWEGAAFVILLALYLAVLFAGGEKAEVHAEFEEAYGRSTPRPVAFDAAGVAIGLGLLVAGAQLLVVGATAIARGLGVSELVIGLTLVAVGTSLPELATSLVAALKRETDIALGNIVGSNIFNILGILGITVLVKPIALPFAAVATDLWVMLALSVILLPFLVTGLRLGRREGGALLALYLGYVAYLYAS